MSKYRRRRSQQQVITPEEWVIVSRRKWRRLRWWIVLFSAVTIFLLVRDHNLVTDNTKRTNELKQLTNNRLVDIQASRLYSCRKTYKALRELIDANVPPGTKLSKQQQIQLARLRTIADPKRCKIQVKPSVAKP